MSIVSRIYSAKPVSEAVEAAYNSFDISVGKAIDQAKDDGLPQALLVAALTGHQHLQIDCMLKNRGGQDE